MFHSNLPTLLGRQDFEQSHADLLQAARAGETVDPLPATDFVIEGYAFTPINVADIVAQALLHLYGDHISRTKLND